MKKLSTLFTFLFLLTITLSFAQSTPKWTANFEKTIEWTKLMPNGILLIGTSDFGLHGIDPQNGNIIWSEEKIMKEVGSMKGADGKKKDYSDEYITSLGEFDPQLKDFISVQFSDNVSLKNFIVINTKSGQVVFHPSDAGAPSSKFLGKTMYQFNFGGSGVIADLKLIVFQINFIDFAVKGKPEYNFLKGIDLLTGKELWKVDGVSGDKMPMVLKDKKLLYFNNSIVAKLDPVTGNFLWTLTLGTDKKDVISQVTYDLDEKIAYVFGTLDKRASIVAIDIQNGKQLWNNEFKAKGEPMLIATRSGLVMSDDKNFTMYDFASGNEKWSEKKLDGDVVDMGSDGILVAAREKFLVLLDGETGAEKWSKRVKGIHISQVTDKGIIYYDEKNALGVVDYKGNEFWKKNLPEIAATVQANFTTLVLLSDNDLYKIDMTDFSQTVLAKNIKFKGDEIPETIEVYEDGIVVSASQNYWKLNHNGEIVFQKFFIAPGAGAVLATKILKTTLMVVGTAMASANAYQQGAAGNYTTAGQYYGGQRKAWEDFTNGIGQIDATKSYKKATKNSDFYAYILTKVEEADVKGTGIVKLNKLTGATDGEIVLKDSKPVYEVDTENKKIFHRVSNKIIACYDL